MIRALLSSHPSPETLSRLADQDEVSRARSRAGRHLARCPECRAVVEEYDALGTMARRVAAQRPSDVLRDRVLAAAPEVVVLDARALPARRRLRRPLALAAIAAGVLLAALAWPLLRQHDLAAADAERLTLLPGYPRAGSVARVRFVAPPTMPAADTLWLEGVFRVTDEYGVGRDELPVATPLVRAGDAYVGTLAVPAHTLAGSLQLLHSRWPRARYHTLANALVLTSGAAPDRPSLDALEEASLGARFWQARPRLVAEFARWAPDHPMRWALAPAEQRGGAFDWLGFFTSREHRFAQLTRALNARKSVRAGELAGMASLAYEIEEPQAAAEWTDRLVREYPTSPWAAEMRAAQIHALELRSAPRDSIAALMPSLDSLLRTAPRAAGDPWTLDAIIERNGDSLMLRHWSLRMAHAGTRSIDLLGRRRELADPEIRDSVEAGARERIARIGAVPGPENDRVRAFAYGQLASVALARGEYRKAIALTDSSHNGPCRWPGRDTRALAFLALGDTASAERYLFDFAGTQWAGADSVHRILGARASGPRWTASVDSAARAARECRKREDGGG